MKMTLAQASKKLTTLQQTLNNNYSEIDANATFVASIQENKEENRPNYDLFSSLNEMSNTVEQIKDLKHKINVFNTTTKVGNLNLTIDNVLYLLPVLNSTLTKLERLSVLPEKKRVNRQAAIIDYEYINFDKIKVMDECNKIREQINNLQLELDKTNNTILFEF